MSNLTLQASFNSGEWAPALYARVDIQKYRSGAALLENFYIDYRGGASSRPGTKYVIQCYKSSTAVRLITFQASFNVGYVLEFGNFYLRFHFNGAPIVEAPFSITAITQANPCVVTAPGHNYSVGDWVFITGVNGMTQVDGRYFNVQAVAGNNITLGTLNGVNIDSTRYGAYTSGGTTARIYTITTPYGSGALALLKFSQITNEMVLCHPSHVPYLLTNISPANWTLNQLNIGSTATAPNTPIVTSTLGGGPVCYSYIVTSIDANGQESGPSSPGALINKADIRSTAGSNKITWAPVPGAAGYNVYESAPSYFGVVPIGVNYGFIGTTKGTTLIDSNIGQNFAESPPVPQDPFVGNGVAFVTVTAPGTYTTVPSVNLTGGSPDVNGTAEASLGAASTPAISSGGSGYKVNDSILFDNGLVLTVNTIGGGGAVTAWSIASAGSITSGNTPSNPVGQLLTSGTGTGASATVTWGVTQVIVLVPGAGYISAPSVSFSSGAATATATLSGPGNGNPAVPGFFQQRLFLGAQPGSPQTFHMSQPGNYFNFDITDPAQADNAITETLVSGTLQTIKFAVPVTAGLLIFTDKATWLVNGGNAGSAVSPLQIVANLQSSVGASDVPPIIANYDILFVSSKGSSVRDNAYNIYFNVFTGTDISVTSSHLFYGFTINEWAWAEQPFYVVWAVRSDGTMLTLTFLKEQEFVGWTHQTTQGAFLSVCAVTESTTAGNVDAVYAVVRRVVNGVTVRYIERVADRIFQNGLSSAWCVDAGIQYSGAPQLNFIGAEHLAGLTVTGLATDNLGNVTIITPFTMPVSGFFTLPAPAPVGATGYTTVTLGLGFTCKLQTLAIDTGQAPIQGKLKKIPHVDVRVNQTLGLQIGSDFDHLVTMKDLQQGAISSMSVGLETQLVNGLYSGDARTYLDPSFNIYGQYCIQQSNPYPATILGVIPCLEMGDVD